jgi:hypothetical protein
MKAREGKILHFGIPEDLHKRAKMQALREDTTLHHLFINALKDYVDQREQADERRPSESSSLFTKEELLELIREEPKSEGIEEYTDEDIREFEETDRIDPGAKARNEATNKTRQQG